MQSNLNISLILLLGAGLSASVSAQATNSAAGNTVILHEPKRLESAPQPPADLRQMSAELSGMLVGQSPNISIEFVLSFQNNWSQDVKILDPLDSLFLQFTTTGNKLIRLPRRVSKILVCAKPPKGAILGAKPDAPYPAPVQFRQITRDAGVSSQKEETITIPPGGRVQIIFDSEPVVMQKVVEALQTETGEAARSFKIRAIIALISAQPQVGSRSLYSDWIFFTIPSS
jgi:hypothetical protein